jgi:hypothetical protein
MMSTIADRMRDLVIVDVHLMVVEDTVVIIMACHAMEATEVMKAEDTIVFIPKMMVID